MIGADRLTSALDLVTVRLDPESRALLGKEVRTVVRDAAQWSQVFMMAALLFIYLYNIRMMPLEGDARAALLAWLNLGMTGFVVAAICLRFAYPSMSSEGRQFWILRTAPVTMRRLLWIKTAVYLLPLLAISLLLTVTANVILDAGTLIWIYTIASSVVITSTLVGLGVGLGALAPDFRSENPVQVALSLGGFAYMSLSLLYVGLMMFLFTRPVQRFAVKMIFGIDLEPTFWTTAGPVVVGLFISAMLFAIPLELARSRLQRERP